MPGAAKSDFEAIMMLTNFNTENQGTYFCERISETGRTTDNSKDVVLIRKLFVSHEKLFSTFNNSFAEFHENIIFLF